MQLDIFGDSRDVMLRNDVVGALERRDAAAALECWVVLAEALPADTSLASLELLIGSLSRRDPAPFADHAAAKMARLALVDRIEPAARTIFGHRAAGDWLRPLRRELAERSAGLAFDSEHEDDHPAPSWLQAGDPHAAAAAVKRIESWRRIPAPLGWMAEALHRIEGLEGAWPLLAELAWLAPERFGIVSQRLADPALGKLLKAFGASFDGVGQPADLAWFPAWVLTEKPGLARWLGPAERSLDSAPEQGMRCLLDLLHLEKQGRHHEATERRKRLFDISPPLFETFMRHRR